MRARTGKVGVALTAALCAFAATPATAQKYPDRPIRLIIPYAPGGSSDAIGRLLGQSMGNAMGQSLVIDNRPGAASMIGRSMTAKAAPDGYTLMIGDAVHSINVHVLRAVPYHPIRDFTFISLVGHSPMVRSPSGLMTSPKLVRRRA